MNPTYRQSVQPPRQALDWSWERGPRLWTRRSPLELPPISWGSLQLIQDRLHAQNQNRDDDSDSSFYSISDLESSIEIDLADSLLDHLERGAVPVPEDLGSREPQGLPPVIPGTLSRQWSTPRQPRLVRSDWWLPPQVPLYRSVYDRPRYTTSWGTPVSGATGFQVITRVPPAVGDQEADRVSDGTRGGSSLPGVPVQEDTGQALSTRGSTRPRSGGPGCLQPISRTALCPPTSRTRPTCQPRPQPVWEDEDLVVTRPLGEPLVFRFKHTTW